MTQIKPMYKTVSALLVVLTVILTASTGFSFAYPNPITPTQMSTSTMVSGMSSPLYSVNIANKPDIGSYLTNATGWTLYIFARDIPTNGTSRCTGNCIKAWPAFYTSNLNLPPGLNATSFTVITRPDGGKQLAYNGWPLYYFANDKKLGDTTGQGVNKLWFACTFPVPTILTSTTATTTTTSSTTTTTSHEPGGGY